MCMFHSFSCIYPSLKLLSKRTHAHTDTRTHARTRTHTTQLNRLIIISAGGLVCVSVNAYEIMPNKLNTISCHIWMCGEALAFVAMHSVGLELLSLVVQSRGYAICGKHQRLLSFINIYYIVCCFCTQ